jgi:acetoin utilization deacetylase AcuC-like enzyme
VSTTVAWNPSSRLHQAGAGHPERPQRIEAVLEALRAPDLAGVIEWIEAAPASREPLERVHPPAYLDALEALAAAGGAMLDPDTVLGARSWDAALASAGVALAVVERGIRDGTAFGATRPPGHHALAACAMGFCFLNNVVIAARHGQALGRGRVLIVDWDVHHGNGTQAAFYARADVLTISVHQDRWYPGDSGGLDERGEGPGLGFNLNIPLPPGSGHGAYLAAFERVVVPALHAFRPELIVVPSGFDGSLYDPLGRMMAYSETYRAMTRMLMAAAGELCGGRLVLTHEGGYAPLYVPFCGLAVMEELSGVKTAVDDPMAPRAAAAGGQELAPHQDEVIRRAERMLSGRLGDPHGA